MQIPIRPCEAMFDMLGAALAFDYVQWIEESQDTWDYKIMASRCPVGRESYDIAHRTGVIGQVFRRERPIFIPSARAHPIYDVYDPIVKWELAIPLLDGLSVAGVLNFEGSGDLELEPFLWRSLGTIASLKIGLQFPEAMPEPGEAWVVNTSRVVVSESGQPASDAALRLGRAAASGGVSVLVAGVLDLPSSPTYPTVESALRKKLPIGGCFRGGGHRLDLLVVGDRKGKRTDESAWWGLAEGRYDYVLLVP